MNHSAPLVSHPASPATDSTWGLVQGAAFVLLCLWTRTTPDRLRDQLSPEAGTCATLGF
ncbi:hypothetical protein MKK88_20150 [Methylobacterium sp. E-005]|uniref:hypothetical protein n=1 Tax=Methylobacterium sp. E-005 TaxID=2836549 RepID=UPI001FB9C905|nr:hypothetical protein [Methylobacterium sp. E-005]MCJ2088278.1 hypothetical protein [Methylobacterium sp. E-005]